MKAVQESKLEDKISKAEQIGALISPSTNTLLNITLLEDAEKRNMVGNFCIMYFPQENKKTVAVGQINSITLRNPYLERHSIQKIISVRGQAPPLTGQHDVRLVEMSVGAVYSISNGFLEPTTLGSLPQTGTNVYLLNSEVMEALLEPFLVESFFIGRMYNTDYLLPTIFKHFGKADGGLGEAYHVGIFGKTGSGKSYLAKMIIAGYSRHVPMSILIVDPQGEFSKEVKQNTSLVKAFKKFKRNFTSYDISQLSLMTYESFERLIRISSFLREAGIAAEENQENAIRLLRNIFEGRIAEPRTQLEAARPTTPENISLANCYRKDIFERILTLISQNIARIYVTQEAQTRVREIIRQEGERLYTLWRRFTLLFSRDGRTSLTKVVSDVCKGNDIVVLNLSETTAGEVFWNDSVLAVVLKEVVDQLKGAGSSKFIGGETLNLLVCIDEAHRFAPSESPMDEDYRRLKGALLDAVKTTRKYGLGWMFISQTLASLDKEILDQLRLYFFGYGLSWGTELRTLKGIVGGRDESAVELYQNFKDPQTSAILGKKEYPFMAFGPVSVLSISGSPVFFTALDYFDGFVKVNSLEDVRK